MGRIIKSYDASGNELIILSDEAGVEAASMTIESIFDDRIVEEPQATNILTAGQLEGLKTTQELPSRLEIFKGSFTHKETGKIYFIKSGNMPEISDRIKKDMSGTFFFIHEPDNEEIISVLVPFRHDGTIPETFPYIIKEENEQNS